MDALQISENKNEVHLRDRIVRFDRQEHAIMNGASTGVVC